MRLVTILIMSFVFVGVIGGIGGVYYFYSQYNEVMVEQVYSHLESVAQSRAEHVKTFLGEKKILAENLALIGKVEQGLLDPSEANIIVINERLQKTTDSVDSILSMGLLDKNGILVASTTPELIGTDYFYTDYFQRAERGVSFEIIESPGRESFFGVGAPVKDSLTGEFLGVIGININLYDLNKITADKTGIGETGETYLVDKDGYAITSLLFVEGDVSEFSVDSVGLSDCLSVFENFDAGEFVGEHIGHEAVKIYPSYHGGNVIGAHYPIYGVDWCLIAEIDEGEILGVLKKKLLRTSFIILISLVIFISLIGFFVAKFVSRPIKKLTRDVDEITKGKLDIQLPRSRVFEVQGLTDSLTRILASLKLAILRKGIEMDGMGIDEAIKAKEEAEEEVQKLASVVTHTSELVNLSDPDGKMIFINRAGSEMSGIAPEKVENYNIMDVIPKHLRQKVEKELLPTLRGGEKWEGNLEYKNVKTNKLTPVHAIAFSIKDPKTKKIKYFANISARIIKENEIVSESVVEKIIPKPVVKKNVSVVRKVGSIEKKLRSRADEIDKKRIGRVFGERGKFK